MVYALDQPSHALKSPEHASFVNELDFGGKKVSPVHKDLVESACIHRRKLITEALERGNSISIYMCSNCLERYARTWEKYKDTDIEKEYKMYLKQHMKTLVKYIETYPDRYRIRLLKKCPQIRYERLYLPVRNDQGKVENKISKVFFLGREPECLRDKRIIGGSSDFGFGQGFGDLMGFATDLENLLDFFHKQHIGIKDSFVDSRFEDPKKMVEHIEELIFKNIPEND